MGCGGCGRKNAAIKNVPRAVPPPPAPPPMSVAPVVRSLPTTISRGVRPPIIPPPNSTNIVIRSSDRKCKDCGQNATFQLMWSERLRRYYEVSKCPCSQQ